jgi:hypothetical protein
MSTKVYISYENVIFVQNVKQDYVMKNLWAKLFGLTAKINDSGYNGIADKHMFIYKSDCILSQCRKL